MINPSMISCFPSWCRRWNSFRPEPNRRKGATGLLAIAGAAAMDSFVGQVWLGDGCETTSIESLALDCVVSKRRVASPILIARNQPIAN